MAKKRKVVEIIIDEEYCKGCNICVELCPKDVFESSGKINTRGYYTPIISRLEQCDGCKICDLVCPEMSVILSYDEI
jgi:2-oxoglutarate ferredoxin oxidoreductase subunit delta